MAYESTLLDSIQGRLIRGGTSRGLFVREGTLPDSDPERTALILELFGSPDPLQLDGVGGSHSHTSKLMIVGRSTREGIDLRYTFGQVGIETDSVDFGGNCGNLTAAIGVYGILEGLVESSEPVTELTLYNTNTDTLISQEVPVTNGEPTVKGNYAIDGVPGTGARIESRFHDPGGGVTGSLLPTGNAVDEFEVEGVTVPVSIVDVANPNVFVRAADVGMAGTELPSEIEADEALQARLERIRSLACARIGLVDDPNVATELSPGVPYVAVVSKPRNYKCSVDKIVQADDIDVTARIMSNQSPHHAYAMTGAMCLTAAAAIPGTLPASVSRAGPTSDQLRIGHPKGTVKIGVESTGQGDDVDIEWVSVGRHARLIMGGRVYHRPLEDLDSLAE